MLLLFVAMRSVHPILSEAPLCAPQPAPALPASPAQLTCRLVPALQAAAVQQAPGSSASRPPSARVKRKFEDVEQGEVPTAGATAAQQAPVIAQGLSRTAVAVATAGDEDQAPASGRGLSLPPGDRPAACPSCLCCCHSDSLRQYEAGHLASALKEAAKLKCFKKLWIFLYSQ